MRRGGTGEEEGAEGTRSMAFRVPQHPESERYVLRSLSDASRGILVIANRTELLLNETVFRNELC